MTAEDYSDWKVGPSPRRCATCSMPESSCEGGQLFGKPPCCDSCDHDEMDG